jgi:hypothetical protein
MRGENTDGRKLENENYRNQRRNVHHSRRGALPGALPLTKPRSRGSIPTIPDGGGGSLSKELAPKSIPKYVSTFLAARKPMVSGSR